MNGATTPEQAQKYSMTKFRNKQKKLMVPNCGIDDGLNKSLESYGLHNPIRRRKENE